MSGQPATLRCLPPMAPWLEGSLVPNTWEMSESPDRLFHLTKLKPAVRRLHLTQSRPNSGLKVSRLWLYNSAAVSSMSWLNKNPDVFPHRLQRMAPASGPVAIAPLQSLEMAWSTRSTTFTSESFSTEVSMLSHEISWSLVPQTYHLHTSYDKNIRHCHSWIINHHMIIVARFWDHKCAVSDAVTAWLLGSRCISNTPVCCLLVWAWSSTAFQDLVIATAKWTLF